ncbi:MAG: formylglycine-generating enzyme family protein, partial [Thermodesulfobacteriota bacterium]|nr:formylglycine-generating enzyme family protein [Thermodesulfobacteriota bacterium]
MLKNIVSIVVFMLLLSQVATVNAGFVPGFELGDGSGDNHAVSGSSFTDPTTGMEFVLVKGGCYQMGDTFGDGQSNEKPVHKVCVDDFYMGKYEVTQKQYQKIVGSNPSSFKGSNRPVEEVSWNDAQGFIRKLN